MATQKNVWSLLVWLVFSAGVAVAQVTTATILGTVTDESGAVVPGVSVTAKNEDTGMVRTATTNERGSFGVRQLPVGTYDLTVEMQGFQTAVRSGIKLAVGQEAAINVALSLGSVTEKITVTAEAPVVEVTTSSLASRVDDKQMRELPLNGRDFTQLLTLQTGASQALNTGGTVRANTGTGSGKRISVSGTRTSANTYLVDGTEVADVFRQTPGSVSGGDLGIEAIREFSMLTNSYDASYSSQGGAIINAVTRAGTNEMHGSVFEFHRNSVLDANEFFLNAAKLAKPGFKRNQFGFALGGPIFKDRTFYFGTLELLRQRKAETNTGRVLTDLGRNGTVCLNPTCTQTNTIGVHPDIVPFIGIMPRGNGKVFTDVNGIPDGTQEFVSSFSEPIDQSYWMTRVDHRFSDSDNFFARYTFDHSTQQFPNSAINTTLGTGRNRWQYITAEHNHIFSPTVINTLRIGFTRMDYLVSDRPLFAALPCDRFCFNPASGLPFGESSDISFDGGVLSTYLTGSNLPKHYTINNYHYQDDIGATVGSHQLKMGVLVKQFQTNLAAPQNLGGSYVFPTVLSFWQAKPRQYQGATPGSSADRSMRQWLTGLFIADSYQVRPRITLNVGLRYERSTVPTEKYGRVTNVRDALALAPVVGNPLFTNAEVWKNFQPRIGFAWDLLGDGKTALRGGFGMFRQHLLSNAWFITIVRQPPLYTISNLVNPPFLGVGRTVQPTVAGAPGIQSIDFDIHHPYVLQYNLTLQREIMRETSLSVAYAGSRGNNLLMNRTANIKQPTILSDGRKCFNYTGGNPLCPNGSLSRRNPSFIWDARQSSWAQSFYNSLQVNLDRRFSQGLQLGIAYTWSKAIDEGFDRWDQVAGDTNGIGGSSDPDDHKRDRGLADFDIRHNFILKTSYELPKRDFGNTAARVLLSGWQLNGILRFSSGNPFTAILGSNRAESGAIIFNVRPDLKAGADNNPVLGGPDKYFDPSAFVLQERGFFGNVARNTIIGPGLRNLDLALMKTFNWGEQRAVEFRAEFFNLTNTPHFARPFATVDVGGAGRINSTISGLPGREIQFGLKVNF